MSDRQWSDCRNLHHEYVQQMGTHALLKPYFAAKNFLAEIERMPEGYEPPDGICLMAYFNGVAIGTVGLRKMKNGICEMKRLFVKPIARGTGLGRKLVERVIEEGRLLGFSRMRLDNSRSAMEKANALYKALGFYEIDRYNSNFVSDAYFMEKLL